MNTESKTIRVRPPELTTPLLNPHKGFSTFQRFNGDECYHGPNCPPEQGPEEFNFSSKSLLNKEYPATTMVYCRWFWYQLEPQRKKYRWDLIDDALKVAKMRGQTLSIRLMPNGSSGNKAPAPEWYAGLAPTRIHPKNHEHIFPDYNSDEYYQLWTEFLTIFAERYEGHPRIDYIDSAYNGAWGEGEFDAYMEPHNNERMAQFYLDTFKKTPLLSLTNAVQMPYMTERGSGWRADCFGDMTNEAYEDVPAGRRWNHMYDEYPRLGAIAGEAWRTAPMVFESAWIIGLWHEKKWPVDWIIEQGLKYHCSSCMAKSGPVPEEWIEKMEVFSDRMGYRYVMRQFLTQDKVELNEKMSFSVWVENNGVAPVYQPYEFKLLFIQCGQIFTFTIDDDCRNWLPGDTYIEKSITLPAGLKKGRAELSCIIQNKNASDLIIRFANQGNTERGEMPLMELKII